VTQNIRYLPFSNADGPHNMAADEIMLESARLGQASMRVYSWSPPTLSLGYFQRSDERLAEPRFATLPWVRRATGGGAIVHDGDLTYALALPPCATRTQAPAKWHCRIHRVIGQFLRDRLIAAEVVPETHVPGASAPLHELNRTQRRRGAEGQSFDCFAIPQPGDVVVAGQKIVGGAQRLRAGALMQHGSIQVPEIHAVWEQLGPFLAAAWGWQITSGEWTDEERNQIEHLAVYKYNQIWWNEKR
jgi:lipoate-protein ligase A